jgi:ubiquinone/menaquinone biosynthesis C-methylase UbiE
MDEHRRFVQQAGWTRPLREYFWAKEEIRRGRRILEVGCGSGAVLQEWASAADAPHGLDLSRSRLREAKLHLAAVSFTQADARALPYAADVFDLVFCHYFLLWVPDPLQALREMRRVTRPGGFILALAEPDYSARIEEPLELMLPALWQIEALRRQGADVTLGPRLPALFAQAGIALIESGCLTPRPPQAWSAEELAAEWQTLRQDLAQSISQETLRWFDQIEQQARVHGQRYSCIPTWFAWGCKPP